MNYWIYFYFPSQPLVLFLDSTLSLQVDIVIHPVTLAMFPVLPTVSPSHWHLDHHREKVT